MSAFLRRAALVVAMAVVAVPVLADEEPSAATVLARVGETEITLGHAIALRNQLPPQFQQIPAVTLFPAIVEQLIDQELLLQSGADTLSLRDRLTLDNEVRNFIANSALTAAVADAVDDAAIAAAYEAFAAEFAQGEPTTEYNAAHILVQTEEEIAAVVERLEAGEEFGD
ncbi:MAG: peptidylprolyl isomerase, partial [Pararhodobacter sp.]|nr:peptidylprolyl isomerase [Pararhodobacter sp.]